MIESSIFVGMDVHKDSVDIAVAEQNEARDIRLYGKVSGDLESVDKAIRKLNGQNRSLHLVYEAGPCGYSLYRHLKRQGLDCVVVAPSLIPKRSGDRIKTDRRDALSLARLHRAGELSPVYVPTEQDEAIRDLTRAREDAVIAQNRGRQLLQSLLLRNGIRYTGKCRWRTPHLNWLAEVKMPEPAQQIVFQEYIHAIEESHQRIKRLTDQIQLHIATWRLAPVVRALQALRGVSTVVASGVIAELGDLTRFDHPKRLAAYVGLVPSEHSSGLHTRRGRITKTGNTHARRLLVEAAWTYQRPARVTSIIRKRQINLPKENCDVAWRAQLRLSALYRRMVSRGKNPALAVTAVARELLGFMWEIARRVPLAN